MILLRVNTYECEYVRKMFDDLNDNKRSFLFSVQKYIGMRLDKKDIENLINNNFYILSKSIKYAYSKIIFKDNTYKLKHPVIGSIWAITFYVITVLPTLLYIVFIMDVKNILSQKTYLLFNIQILPLFIFLCLISIINLSMFGTAKSICKIKKYD